MKDEIDVELSVLSGLYEHAHLDFQPRLYRTIRETGARTVVETGVNIGISTYYALHALAANGGGILYSADPMWRTAAAALFRFRMLGWTPPKGAMWRFTPERGHEMMARVEPPWDIFVHDSDHSYDNMVLEMDVAWPKLRSGGVMFVDDIQCREAGGAFADFLRIASPAPTSVHWGKTARVIKP